MGRGRYKKKPSYQKGDNNNTMDENFIQVTDEMDQPVFVAEEPVIIEQPSPIYKVRVTHPSLRVRSAPSGNANVVRLITDGGLYDIFAIQGEWGQLADGNWIMLTFTQKEKTLGE